MTMEHEIFYRIYGKNLSLEYVDKCWISDFLFSFGNDVLSYNNLRINKITTPFIEDSFLVYNVYDTFNGQKLYRGCCFIREQVSNNLYPRNIQKLELLNAITFETEHLLVKMQTVSNYNDKVIINQQFTDKGVLTLAKGLIYAFDFYNSDNTKALFTAHYLHKKERPVNTMDIIDGIYFLVEYAEQN